MGKEIQHKTLIVWTMLSLMVIIGMCVDLVAPSLPAIASGLSVSNHMAKNAISVYLLGFALGNFFTGFLTDAWGRQKLMRVALLLFVIASLMPVFFPTIHLLLFARLWQGLAIGGVSVLLRSVCSDVLSPDELTQLGPWFGTMWGLGPVIGPILGGYLQVYFGWQAGFLFFSIITAIAFLIVFFVLPETHCHRHPLRLDTIKLNLVEVLSRRLFVGMICLMGLSYSLLVVFNVAGPFLIENELHYSPIFFGHIAFYVGLVFLFTTLIARMLIKKFDIKQIWLIGINGFLVIALLLLGLSYAISHNIIVIAIASAFMFSACGLLFPASLGKALSLFRHIAGTATAVMYLVNIGITSLVSYFIGFIPVTSLVPLMWINASLLIGVALLYWCVLRHRE